MQHQHPPFTFDSLPSGIRSINFHDLIPTKPLTDRAIFKYMLDGKYGPEWQAKAREVEAWKTLKKRESKVRREVKGKLKKILDNIGY